MRLKRILSLRWKDMTRGLEQQRARLGGGGCRERVRRVTTPLRIAGDRDRTARAGKLRVVGVDQGSGSDAGAGEQGVVRRGKRGRYGDRGCGWDGRMGEAGRALFVVCLYTRAPVTGSAARRSSSTKHDASQPSSPSSPDPLSTHAPSPTIPLALSLPAHHPTTPTPAPVSALHRSSHPAFYPLPCP